ncbi:hypothetical protein [Cuneatibacter caecimuris]|uniref:Uncharacterized protein n=1 Tax=Cuneatibacter caecimuris TaxID=1796618 RepID=A0A4Q7PQK4_9FIRM|nr:hypothetical protein [Cuneatibacter caecimuris]RZT02298.1 hypothetical protein EV209_0409 [Cuneatibacter caecimuris]
MKRWQNTFGEGRKTRGDAMVVVLCIFAVLLALAVSLLLAASTMTGAARRAAVSERCRTAAVSFSKLLEEDMIQKEGSLPMIQAYLREQIPSGNWTCYDESTGSDVSRYVRKLVVSDGSKTLGAFMEGYEVTAEMYWKADRAALEQLIKDMADSTHPENAYEGISLILTVQAARGKEIFRVQTTYALTCSDMDGAWTWNREVRE